MSEIIRGGASIEALEIVVNAFYPKQFWVPCTYQLRTAARSGNITVFDWVRNRNPALEIDALLLETAKCSGNPRMQEHIYRSSFACRSAP
jgi:hypothetical protein